MDRKTGQKLQVSYQEELESNAEKGKIIKIKKVLLRLIIII